MRQVQVKKCTCTADVSGVCSALFELGGMVVIHDPSGCNSTYNTHDEPRWYDRDSLIFISGLSEMDALEGNDDKFIADIEDAAGSLHPAFIVLVRSPIPMMTGTDFEAIAGIVQEETGIPTFYVPTDGMHSYIEGAGRALEEIVRLAPEIAGKMPQEPAAVPKRDLADRCRSGVNLQIGTDGRRLRVNLLGVTPLDFSIGTSLLSMKEFLRQAGFDSACCLAMDTGLPEIAAMGGADVNLVVSTAGLPAARFLKDKYGTPYVVGMPCGFFSKVLAEQLHRAAAGEAGGVCLLPDPGIKPGEKSYIVGEPVICSSIARALALESGNFYPRVICPIQVPDRLRLPDVIYAESEEELEPLLGQAGVVIADPLMKTFCGRGTLFIHLPHEACSGRMFRAGIPDLVRDCPQRILKAPVWRQMS